jgi:tetratricopeptide (TPR) repeat protein
MFTSLGGSLQQTGLTASANSLFQRALDLQKENEGALLSLAVYAEKTGHYDKAVIWLERLTEAHPANSEAWLRLGINLARLDKREASARWLAKAQSAAALPWVRELAFEEAAAAARRREAWAEAERILRAGIEQLPGSSRLYLSLANALDHQGQVRSAVAELAELQASPDVESPRMLYNRWPAAVLEASRRELKNTAQSRLAALARAVGNLGPSGDSR